MSRAHISKIKRCFNVKSAAYYFHRKTKVLTDFQFCISVPLSRAYTMKFFFHRWLNFSFGSFLSTFNTSIQLANVNEIFQSTVMKVFQKKKFLPDF